LVITFGEAKQRLCLCKLYRVLSDLSCCEALRAFFYCLFVDNFALCSIGIIFGVFVSFDRENFWEIYFVNIAPPNFRELVGTANTSLCVNI
jgi:hypothetical protein